MPVVFDEVRKLATVAEVAEIRSIPEADKICVAVIRGWNVVIKKNEFQVGDQVVYFEEDTSLPVSDPRFAFLASRGTKKDNGEEYHILKIAKLRGVFSQGLILPLEYFAEQISNVDPDLLAVGSDVTVALGLGKWEAPMPVNRGDAAGTFLTKYARRTDSERIQNLTDVWNVIKETEWDVTEKLDGTSCTVIRDEDGVLRVCSRNFEVKDGDNVYWNVVHRFNKIFDCLNPNMAVQFEIVGNGVQGNRLKLSDPQPFIFDVVSNGTMVPRSEWNGLFIEHSVPVIEGFVIPDSPAELIDMVNGMKSLVSPSVLAEGIVFHTFDGHIISEVGGRNTFKVISQKYLMKG